MSELHLVPALLVLGNFNHPNWEREAFKIIIQKKFSKVNYYIEPLRKKVTGEK